MENIKFSILVPVYNAEKYIGSLLDRILQQMNDSMEVILLNDGSCDLSEKICAEYAENNPSKIRFITRENKGAVFTRRELFQAAAGEWIWIIDSDDMITENSLSLIMKEIKSDDSFDMILFDHYLNKEAKESIVDQLPYDDGTIFEGVKKNKLYKELICGAKMNQLWNKVFKQKCIDFDADYSEYEDVRKANDCLQVFPIITQAQKIKYRQIPIYVYNTDNQNSLSHKFQYYTYTSLKKVWERKREYIHKWEMWTELENYYFDCGSCVAVELLVAFVFSDTSKKEYLAFFDEITNDGVFSEAIEKCDVDNLKIKNEVLLFIIRRKWKRFFYALLSIWKLIR